MKQDTQALLEDLKTSCNYAFGELYEKHFTKVASFIQRNNGTVQDAEDIFQDTMLVLCKKLRQDQFKLTASLRTYILAIAKNLWLKKLRATKKEIEHQDQISQELYHDLTQFINEEQTLWNKIAFYFTQISEACARLLKDIFYHRKPLKQIQQEYKYKNLHTAQNQKYKCMQQVKKAKEKQEQTQKS